MNAIEKQINAFDWSLEPSNDYLDPKYRAKQGNFYTTWRATPEQVFQDVLRIKQAREKEKI